MRAIREELTRDKSATGNLPTRLTGMLDTLYRVSSRSMDRYVSLLYQRGIDRTISDIMWMDRTVQMDARFTTADQEMIKGLSTDAYTDITTLHKQIAVFVDKAVKKAEKDKTGVNRAVNETYEAYNSQIIPLVERLCTSVSCRAYNAAAHRVILAYAPGKMWKGPADGFTRKSHAVLIGTVIPAADRFILEEIASSTKKAIPACSVRYPGDTCKNPPGEQVLGCRCWIVPDFTPVILPEVVPEVIPDDIHPE